VFQDQAFVPVGVDAGLAVCDGEAARRVIKPEDNMVPDVIHVLPGDSVTVEMSVGDPSKGRII
jgi:hypothetical protein